MCLLGFVVTAFYADPHKNLREGPHGPLRGLCHPDGPRFRTSLRTMVVLNVAMAEKFLDRDDTVAPPGGCVADKWPLWINHRLRRAMRSPPYAGALARARRGLRSQPLDVTDHALAQCWIGQAAGGGAHVLAHVVDPRGRGDGAVNAAGCSAGRSADRGSNDCKAAASNRPSAPAHLGTIGAH